MSQNASGFLRHRCSGPLCQLRTSLVRRSSHQNAPTGTNPKAVKGPTNAFDAKSPDPLVTTARRTHPPSNQQFRMETFATGERPRFNHLIHSILHDTSGAPFNTKLTT